MIKDVKPLLDAIKGTQTLESIETLLNYNKTKAIKLLSYLRKKGYVKTKRLSNNKRLYDISFQNRLGGNTYFEILNKNSPIKLSGAEIYIIHGKEPSLEETLVNAVNSKSLRQVLSSLALFKKIKDWNLLYRLAKQNNIQRQICSLYELSRTLFKTRKMTKRFQNLSKPSKKEKYLYIIKGLDSKDFKQIEKKWKIYLPFNKEDLTDYK